MSQLSPWIGSQGETVYFSSARIAGGKVFEIDCYSKQPNSSPTTTGGGTVSHILVFGNFAEDVLLNMKVDEGIGDTYVVTPVLYSVGDPGALVGSMDSYRLSNMQKLSNCKQHVNTLSATDKPDACIFPGAEVEFILKAGKVVRLFDQAFAGQSVAGGGTTIAVLPYRVIYDNLAT